MTGKIPFWAKPIFLGALALGFATGLRAAEEETNLVFASSGPAPTLSAALSAAKWRQVENSVDRALAWMASRQAPDGSFPTIPSGQPAVTSLAVMAFLSRGHQPGYGPYGEQLEKAIDFVLSCQMSDGLFSYAPPGPTWQSRQPSHTGSYNHAIAGLMLGEVYGHVTGERMKAVRGAIERALAFARALQTNEKRSAADKGGWRYLRRYGGADADMSVTSWQLMFLRSARNAEFDVPQAYVDEAMEYVHRSFDPRSGTFFYVISGPERHRTTRGLVGAGIVSLSLAGQHQTPMALAAGDWLLRNPFRAFNETKGASERFYYSTYYCSQAAVQLGGRYWEGIFPPLVEALLSGQRSDGSWPAEAQYGDAVFLQVYATAMAVLSLTPAYQLMPVYQR